VKIIPSQYFEIYEFAKVLRVGFFDPLRIAKTREKQNSLFTGQMPQDPH